MKPTPIELPPALRRRADFAALAAIIIAFIGLCLASSRQNSITYDETAHLAAGVSYLRTGDFRLEAFNSPLVRVLIALPVYRDPAIAMPRGPYWQDPDVFGFGFDFMYANAASLPAAIQKSRAIVTLIGALTIVLAFLAARAALGPIPAVATAAVLAFDPTFIAHAGLATADTAAALAFTGAVIAIHALAKKPSPARATVAGAVLGLAVLAKYACVLPALLAPLFVLLPAWKDRAGLRRRGALLLVMYLAAWITVGAFFRFEGVGGPIAGVKLASRTFTRLAAALPPNTPIPLPAQLLQGMDSMSLNNEDPLPNYFMGEIYAGNRPAYQITAFLLKTPLPSLALLVLGAFALFANRAVSRETKLTIAVPLLAHFLLVSFVSNWNIGLRYLLPVYPLGAVIAAAAFLSRRLRLPAAALAAASVITGVAAYPQHLSYFNLASGGPEKAYRFLADSNLDWGQDLIRLKQYTDREHTGQICLAYFGTVDPEIYGIDYRLPDDDSLCPYLAVSVQYLVGLAYNNPDHGKLTSFPYHRFSYLLDRKHDARVGHSILIFRNFPQPQTKE